MNCSIHSKLNIRYKYYLQIVFFKNLFESQKEQEINQINDQILSFVNQYSIVYE